MKNICLTLTGIVIAGLFFQSCTKETQNDTTVSDQSIGQMVRQSSSNGTVVVANAATNAFRIRMNRIALQASKENAVEPSHGVYPSGAMMIKEYLDAQGNVTSYDVMLKSSTDPAAFHGWVWCSFDAEGNSTNNSAMKSAKVCASIAART